MIPKIIHQIYWNRLYENRFHPKVKIIRDKMIKLNPDYKFIIYNQEDIDSFIYKNFNKKICNIYKKINLLVPKSDLARLLILYKEGGIYLDMKSTIECDLDTFITKQDKAILSIERKNWAENFCQWALIFEKEHPIIEYAIKEIIENIINMKYYNDIENMTTKAFGKAIVKFHKKYFNEELDCHQQHNKSKIKNNKIYKNEKTSYRIYGLEYNNKIEYNKYNLNKYLYKPNGIHWRQEQKYKNVLNGFFLKNYCNFLCFNYKTEIILFFFIIIIYIKKKVRILFFFFQ